jgi:hypothetical protein
MSHPAAVAGPQALATIPDIKTSITAIIKTWMADENVTRRVFNLSFTPMTSRANKVSMDLNSFMISSLFYFPV